jgi:hypothetical protein
MEASMAVSEPPVLMKIRNLRAFEREHLGPGNVRRLILTGEVQVDGAVEVLQAHERVPQGINPRALSIDIRIALKESGAISRKWHTVTFEKAVTPGHYSTVDLSYEGATLLLLDVGGGVHKWP